MNRGISSEMHHTVFVPEVLIFSNRAISANLMTEKYIKGALPGISVKTFMLQRIL